LARRSDGSVLAARRRRLDMIDWSRGSDLGSLAVPRYLLPRTHHRIRP